MAAAGPIVAKVESAGASLWQGVKGLFGAAKDTGAKAVEGVKSLDARGAKRIAAADGDFGKAIAGVAKDRPITSAIAATAAVGGTVYAGKQVFGRHSERVMRERANDNERTR